MDDLSSALDRMDDLKSALDWQNKPVAAINDDTHPEIARRIRGALEAFEKRAVAAGLIAAPKDEASADKDTARKSAKKK
ncbi:MAG: hypothetical protein IIB61_02260 [Planctomycetes bacterium]|nr:hypothetical protein [Planctomycetota bacterium]